MVGFAPPLTFPLSGGQGRIESKRGFPPLFLLHPPLLSFFSFKFVGGTSGGSMRFPAVGDLLLDPPLPLSTCFSQSSIFLSHVLLQRGRHGCFSKPDSDYFVVHVTRENKSNNSAVLFFPFLLTFSICCRTIAVDGIVLVGHFSHTCGSVREVNNLDHDLVTSLQPLNGN